MILKFILKDKILLLQYCNKNQLNAFIKRKIMNYINIERKSLVNLNYGLNREIIRSNRAGSYASSTIIGCNTRKYHGLLVVPLKNYEKHVLLSEVEETIEQNGAAARLSVRRYAGGTYYPHGQRYLQEFITDPIPARIYRVGGVKLKKELLLAHDEERIMIRYTVLKATSKTTLKLMPFLAFRSIHALCHENMAINKKVKDIENGKSACLYDGFPDLYMQLSRKNKYVAAPDWNKNISYKKEKTRGYDGVEDLFVPGYFELNVKEGDVIVFSAGTTPTNTKSLTRKFTTEAKSRTPRDGFENSLINSAQQFFVKRGKETLLKAGYHWYDFRFREALTSLAGLTLSYGDKKNFLAAMDTIVARYKKEKYQLPADISLLFFRALQQYAEYSSDFKGIEKKYGKFLNSILKAIFAGKCGTQVRENGLLYITDQEQPHTWMEEVQDGRPIVERYGYAVEINALWYNALRFTEELISKSGAKAKAKKYTTTADNIKANFTAIFWNKKEKSLFDFVTDTEANEDVRSNQIYAASLPYSPLEIDVKKAVLDKVKHNLLTKFGLRTLSPKNIRFKGKYSGLPAHRNIARNQGTVHPFLIAQYCEAIFNLTGKSGLRKVNQIYSNFESEMHIHAIGTISELYDGNAPHKARGAISYAPSVGELLRIKMMIDKYA